ncbi:hypothetical protein ACFYMW_35740 [Streptomyces sp. NPDC006692]|uniref:DUF5983 family protein n=1 Tax=unclassified Streptomyces TaxID=2593676 RepID=UPI003424CCB0
MPDLTILQAVIDAIGEDDRETVLDVLNEYRLAVDPAASDPEPLTTVDTGRVYATRTTTDTGELLAAALLDTTHHTAFTITQYPTDADNGLYIAHTPQDGTRRAQCNAHGIPVAPLARDESARPAAGIHGRIRSFLDLSTLHLAPTTRDTLNAVEGVLSYPLEHGWLMYAPVGAADLARTHAWPEELLPIVQLARAHDCAYILFDADADTTDLLPVFDD